MPPPPDQQPTTVPLSALPLLGGLHSNQPLERGELLSLIYRDQRQRWRAGQMVRVEEYLAECPQLRDDADAILDLLLREMMLREDRGLAPTLAELVQRFPSLGAQIERQYALHQALQSRSVAPTRGEIDPDTAKSHQPLPTGLAAPAPRVLPRIGNYEILGELGRGGMGVVYKARDERLGRLVALKMILRQQHAHEEELARFRREAEAVARLRHPNIVQIYEVGDNDGCPYLTLELVEGGSLWDLMESGPLTPRAAAAMVETLAQAIHHAHQHGIIHRDLKPANVLIAECGVRSADTETTPHSAIPKISDFGLAKFIDAVDAQTRTGDVLGTPLYMPPEQAGGRVKEIGPPTDVYALGAILYEMLTGRPPFVADSHFNLVLAINTEEPLPPSKLRRGVPQEMGIICLKCLEKSPLRRYHSAAALAEDLRRFRNNEPILARPVGPGQRLLKWAHRKPTLAALILVSLIAVSVLLVGGSVYNFRLQQALDVAQEQREGHRQSLVTLLLSHGQELLQDRDWLRSPVLFAGGLRLDPSQEMHRWRLGSLFWRCPRLVQLHRHDRGVTCASQSPNGQQVVTGSADGVARVWDLLSGRQLATDLKHHAAIVQVEFTPDGASILTASADHTARLWDAHTGGPRTPPLQHERPITLAHLTGDGRFLAVVDEGAEIHIWAVPAGQRQRTLRLPGPVTCLAAAPAGSQMAAGCTTGATRVWDCGVNEAPTPELKHPKEIHDIAFSHDGRLLATACADGLARVWDGNTGKPVGSDLVHPEPVRGVRFNPQDKLLATACEDECARIWNLEQGKLGLPTLRHDSEVLAVQFSPDGRWLASTGDDNTVRLWDASTGEPLPPQLPHNGEITQVVIARDSRRLITASTDSLVRVWQLNLKRLRPEETKPVPVPPAQGHAAGVLASPDGQRLLELDRSATAYLRQAGNQHPTGEPLRHASTILGALFSPDGRLILTWSADNTACVWDAATGKLLAMPLRHRGTVLLGCFAAHGRLAATVSRDQYLRVWELPIGRLVAPPLRHPVPPVRLFFSADGKQVSTIGSDGQQRTWKLQRDDRSLEEITREAELLSSAHIDLERGVLPLDAREMMERWNRIVDRQGR